MNLWNYKVSYYFREIGQAVWSQIYGGRVREIRYEVVFGLVEILSQILNAEQFILVGRIDQSYKKCLHWVGNWDSDNPPSTVRRMPRHP